MFGIVLRLANFCRVTFWRLVLRLRGGRLGRRCTIQPGVCLACAPHRPIMISDGVRLMRGVVLSTAGSGRIELGDNVYTRISQMDMTFRACALGFYLVECGDSGVRAAAAGEPHGGLAMSGIGIESSKGPWRSWTADYLVNLGSSSTLGLLRHSHRGPDTCALPS